jgi:hypothetical protein
MRQETRKRLCREFAHEIKKVEQLLGRKLTIWRQGKSAAGTR